MSGRRRYLRDASRALRGLFGNQFAEQKGARNETMGIKGDASSNARTTSRRDATRRERMANSWALQHLCANFCREHSRHTTPAGCVRAYSYFQVYDCRTPDSLKIDLPAPPYPRAVDYRLIVNVRRKRGGEHKLLSLSHLEHEYTVAATVAP